MECLRKQIPGHEVTSPESKALRDVELVTQWQAPLKVHFMLLQRVASRGGEFPCAKPAPPILEQHTHDACCRKKEAKGRLSAPVKLRQQLLEIEVGRAT